MENYKPPKENQNVTEETRRLQEEGCAATPLMKIKTEPPDEYPSSKYLCFLNEPSVSIQLYLQYNMIKYLID